VPAVGGERTVGELLGDGEAVLAPLLDQYGVDVFNAGHVPRRVDSRLQIDTSAPRRASRRPREFASSNSEQNRLRYGQSTLAAQVHDYCSTYPICYDNATETSARCAGAGPAAGDVVSFTNPKGTVHITEGNGGVPGVSAKTTLNNCTSVNNTWCRVHGSEGGAYGRWIANATTLTYQHVENNGSRVTDTFTIVKTVA